MSRLIDRSGAEIDLTVDVLPFTPITSVYRSTAKSIPSATFTTIDFDSEIVDTDNQHDTVINNTRITVVRSGLYHIEGSLAWAANATGDREIYLSVNGLTRAGNTVPAYGGGSNYQNVDCYVQLVAGDYIEMFVAQNSGVALNTLASTALNGQATLTAIYMPPAVLQPVRQKPVVWQGTPGAMPTGPFARFDVLELTVDATNGVIWEFVYRDDLSATLPWHWKGGPALVNVINDGAATDTSIEATSSTAYVALATPGPSITLPRAGDYDVRLEANVESPGATSTETFMSYDIGGTAAVDADALRQFQPDQAFPRLFSHVARTKRKTGLGAVTLTAKYRVSGGTNGGFGVRQMSVTPVRIG